MKIKGFISFFFFFIVLIPRLYIQVSCCGIRPTSQSDSVCGPGLSLSSFIIRSTQWFNFSFSCNNSRKINCENVCGFKAYSVWSGFFLFCFYNSAVHKRRNEVTPVFLFLFFFIGFACWTVPGVLDSEWDEVQTHCYLESIAIRSWEFSTEPWESNLCFPSRVLGRLLVTPTGQ